MRENKKLDRQNKDFALPDWIDEQTWSDFEEMRKKIRRPLTDAARVLAVRRLLMIWQQFGDYPDTVLEQSILNGWQGIWPLHQSLREQRKAEIERELRVGTGPVTKRFQ